MPMLFKKQPASSVAQVRVSVDFPKLPENVQDQEAMARWYYELRQAVSDGFNTAQGVAVPAKKLPE